MNNSSVFVNSDVYPIEKLFLEKYDVDFYQREYVKEKKQIEDIIEDLTVAFKKNWKQDDELAKVNEYSPYFMGEIVLSENGGTRRAIIDGQQRITTITLLLVLCTATRYSESISLSLIFNSLYAESISFFK